MKISTDLLNTVLGIDYQGEIEIKDEQVKYGHYVINMYKFMSLCKEWGVEKHRIELFSKTKEHWQTTGKFYKGKSEIEITGYSGICIINLSICSDVEDGEAYQKSRFEKIIKADSEPEAVFKATEWILENKDNE